MFFYFNFKVIHFFARKPHTSKSINNIITSARITLIDVNLNNANFRKLAIVVNFMSAEDELMCNIKNKILNNPIKDSFLTSFLP
jgi:hypothetical protein